MNIAMSEGVISGLKSRSDQGEVGLYKALDLKFEIELRSDAAAALAAFHCGPLQNSFWDREGSPALENGTYRVDGKFRNVALAVDNAGLQMVSLIGDLSGLRLSPVPGGGLKVFGKFRAPCTSREYITLWDAEMSSDVKISLIESQADIFNQAA